MKKRFIYELIVGIIGITAVFLFGNAGFAVLVLLIIHPFIGKKKMDERESQLFNKVGNATAAITLISCIVIYYSSNIEVNGFIIGKNWLILAVFSFIIAHGASGIVIFHK